MKILFASAEVSPYFKTGGLGDVSRALPDQLLADGHDVQIITPLYSPATSERFELSPGDESGVPWPGVTVPVRFHEHHLDHAAPTILIEQPFFFEDGEPYAASFVDPLATGRRFAFFARAIVHYARAWEPDVIHLNDWPTGMVPVYALLDGLDCPTVFAIHNLAYQGNFSPALLYQAGIPGDLFRIENGIEFHGSASFMKAGLALSDRIVTVSPTYAQEIQTVEFGAGFDGLLRFRHRVLHGILNGLDLAVWQPALDRSIPASYSAVNLKPKSENRAALFEHAHLEDGGPLYVMISRLVHQKGVDIVLDAIPEIVANDGRVAILGNGDLQYERAFERAAKLHPRRVAAFLSFDEQLARLMYAGGDFFLMPSRYEPCGLGQMIAQRYGTPPIVRRTGGLVDTVEDGKTGFSFAEATPAALAAAARRAARTWHARGWVSLLRRCMRLDWSWTRSAAQYEQVYGYAIGQLPG
jgi:starch synthase